MNAAHTPESLSSALRDMTCGKPDEYLIHAAADMLYDMRTLLAQRNELRDALTWMVAQFETLTDSDPDYASIAAKARQALANAQKP